MYIDPISLKLFLAIVEEGSIAAAAERENIAPAAVSRRISDLEGLLGVTLLGRYARGVEPTPAGLALRDLARQALHSLEDIPVQLRDFASGIRGQVRILSNISAITQFLPRDLASFSEAHPHVRILLEESNSAATVRAIDENIADVGVFTAFDHGVHIQSLPYRRDELCLVVPGGHKLAEKEQVAFADLLDEPFVGMRTGSAINLLLATEAARFGRSLTFRVQVTGFDGLCLMVEQGLGIGIAPTSVMRLYAAALQIATVALAEPWAKRELLLGVRSLESLAPAARRLVEHLQKSGAQGPVAS